MNIWQWILVLIPVLRFGAGLRHQIDKADEKKEKVLGRILALTLIFVFCEFVLYKAGVLIIK